MKDSKLPNPKEIQREIREFLSEKYGENLHVDFSQHPVTDKASEP